MPHLPDWFAWVLLAAVALLAWAWWLARTRWSRATRRRVDHALAGEAAAEAVLRDHGYTIEARQVTRAWTLWVDDEPTEVRSRADLLVRRGGRRYVAEVKTGDLAPDPTRPATRRQLMEYGHVFPVAGVLLVDVEAGRVHEVRFTER